MITTTEIAPAPALAPFVRCYSYIEFDTAGSNFIRPTNAMHEMVMTFQFKATPVRVMGANLIQSFANTYGGLIGLFTQNNGEHDF